MPREFGPITQQTLAAIEASRLNISMPTPLTAGIANTMAEAYLSEQKMGTANHHIASHESQVSSTSGSSHPRNLETTQAVLADIYRTSILNTGLMRFELDGTVKWTDKNPDLGHKCTDGNQHTVTFKRTADEPGRLEATSASCSDPKSIRALDNPAQNAPVMPISLTISEITRKIKKDEERRRVEEKLRNETPGHRLRRIRQEAYPNQNEAPIADQTDSALLEVFSQEPPTSIIFTAVTNRNTFRVQELKIVTSLTTDDIRDYQQSIENDHESSGLKNPTPNLTTKLTYLNLPTIYRESFLNKISTIAKAFRKGNSS